MANTIILKKSSVAGSIPAAGALQPGELAVNLADAKLYSKKADGTVIVVGSGASGGTVTSVSGTGTVSGLTLTGTVTGSGSLVLGGSLSLTSSQITTGLGFTPANVAGDTFTGAITVNSGSHQAVIAADGAIELTRSGGGAYIDLKDSTAKDFDVRLQASGNALGISATGGLTLNGATVLTGITSDMVTTALGFTPANKAGDTFTGQLSSDVGGGIASATFALRALNSGYFVGTFARGSAGAYNPLVQANDAAMIFSTGAAGTGALFIGPWSGSSVGLRMDASGNTTVTGSLTSGGLLTVSGTGLNAAVRFSNTTGGRDLRAMQKDDGRFVITDETAGAERLAISPSGAITSMVDFRAPIFYDSNDTGYYTDPTGISNLWRLDAGSGVRVYDNGSVSPDAYGLLSVTRATGANYSYLGFTRAGNATFSMGIDTSNQFWLGGATSGFSGTRNVWWLLVNNSGDVFASNSFRAPIFYDNNNTAYYVDPASGAMLSSATFDGLVTGRSSAATDVNTANDTGSFSIRGSTTSVASISFHRTSAYAINMGLGTDAVFRIGGWSAQSNCLQVTGAGTVQALNDFRAPIFYDSNNTSYFANPAGTSVLSSIALGGATSVPQGVLWASGEIWVSGNGNRLAFTTDASTDSTPNVSLRGSTNDLVVQNWSGSVSQDNFYVFGASRDAACAGNITAYYSDERLKEKTGGIDNALSKVLSLEGFTYVENELARSVGYNNGKQQVGLSAQQVQAILPEAVALAPFDYAIQPDGQIISKSGENYLTVDYSRLVPLLVEAVKEQQAQIAALAQKLN